jgi:hypothetical protein
MLVQISLTSLVFILDLIIKLIEVSISIKAYKTYKQVLIDFISHFALQIAVLSLSNIINVSPQIIILVVQLIFIFLCHNTLQ